MAGARGGRTTAVQERALRTRAELLRAAAEVFSEQGFSRTTLTEITDRAGVTLGAMYFHFRNKGELARAIVQQQPDQVAPPIDSTGLQRVVDITLSWAYQVLEDVYLAAGARLVMEQEFFMESAENSHQQWTRILTDELAAAKRKRELRAATDVDAIARLIVNACTGAQMHAYLETGREDLPERVVDMWHCLLPAIATPTTLRRIELNQDRGRIRKE
ncbi:TetR family transcriptional regulator [Streptomyces spinoverrucosus]|uniref:ScbR family autoregulator-binding transcription factor n=1 Tax=Streptomyces spinoverrucosus TaxID=284043 RepID=UPI0018C41415|nr:ScbR family autoregulator-binding transcription factor [Streptomyces spinoverrucosus]MBG0855469.1 TetR family transcriptional regulator [Streptomyces spinoverrucosus]